MFKKQDFKKIDLLGSGKKNTKIYKVEHIPTTKIYALKEIEAKTIEKLNEYKVCLLRKKQFNCQKQQIILMLLIFTDILFMKQCTIHFELPLLLNT